MMKLLKKIPKNLKLALVVCLIATLAWVIVLKAHLRIQVDGESPTININYCEKGKEKPEQNKTEVKENEKPKSPVIFNRNSSHAK